MKLSAAKPNKKKRPFIEDGKITIITLQEKNKITGFRVKYKDKEKEKDFMVKKQDITSAWKEVEKFTKDIK